MTLQMPRVSQADLEQVASMVLQMHAPEAQGNPAIAKAMNQELLKVHASDEAWGLTEGLLQHPSQVVRFYGAQNAHIKIGRYWETLPSELHPVLLQQTLNLTNQAASPTSPYHGQNGIVLRKLFSALASLILRLTPSGWPNPLLHVLMNLSGNHVPRSLTLEWLEIAITDIQKGAMVEPRRSQLATAISKETPVVLRSITETLTGSGEDASEITAAFKCLEAWVNWGLTSEELSEMLPVLLRTLNTQYISEASSVLVEILTHSVFRDGKATKITTEPLLEWLAARGSGIVKEAAVNGDVDSEELNAVVKLVEALTEHSASWMAGKMEDQRTQAFFGVLLDLTGFPGVAGRDENISETTLALYAPLQEEMIDHSAFQQEVDSSPSWAIAKQFYKEAVNRIRAKVRWPVEQLNKEALSAFETYRRDAGEIMITAFYIMRDDLLSDLLTLLINQLKEGSATSWQEVEATLHCIRFSAEAVPLGEEKVLPSLFSTEVFSRLPQGENKRIQLGLIRTIRAYEEWFKYHSDNVTVALQYLVSSLDDEYLAPEAAIALKSVCDLCRGTLSNHVAAFGQLHGKVASMGPAEQVKVTEAIASVLQAIPPSEAIQPVLAIAQPVLSRLQQCVQAAAQAPDAARVIVMQQLETLTACANGLTPSDEDMFDLEPEETATTSLLLEQSRQNGDLVKLRTELLEAVTKILEIWGGDIEVASTINGFMKASTAPPSSQTLLSLPIAPLLYLISSIAQKNYLSIWPSTATTLIFRMAPTPGIRRKLATHLHGDTGGVEDEQEREKREKEELENVVAGAMNSLVWATAAVIKDGNSMQSNPDIAESFFKFLSAVVTKFPSSFLRTTPDTQSTCMGLATLALSATEQFTLRGAIEFFVSVLNTSRHAPQVLAEAYLPVVIAHGQPVLYASILGAALNSPRSTIPNFAELMVAFVQRVPNETRTWVTQMMQEEGFPGGQATVEAKKKFQSTMMAARTPKRIREALNDFALVCRGLAGTVYGSASTL